MIIDQDKTNDAIDAVIDMVFAEQIFNPGLGENEDKKNELRFAILVKLNEMGVQLVEIEETREQDTETI